MGRTTTPVEGYAVKAAAGEHQDEWRFSSKNRPRQHDNDDIGNMTRSGIAPAPVRSKGHLQRVQSWRHQRLAVSIRWHFLLSQPVAKCLQVVVHAAPSKRSLSTTHSPTARSHALLPIPTMQMPPPLDLDALALAASEVVSLECKTLCGARCSEGVEGGKEGGY